MLRILIIGGIFACAIQALRASNLLYSALWLSGASVLTALVMYVLGAPEMGVIELSVGAGLVTILFVFAINIIGEEEITPHYLLPKPLSIGLTVTTVILLGLLSLKTFQIPLPAFDSAGITGALWGERELDVILHIVLIFAGVLGVLNLLAEDPQTGKE